MFKFLKRIFGKAPSIPKDPWAGGSESYVSAFYRKNVEQFANAFSGLFGEMQTRFNLERRCAEVYITKTGLVIFQASVNGSLGTPYEAVITAVALTPAMKLMIQTIFDGKIRIVWRLLIEVPEPAIA